LVTMSSMSQSTFARRFKKATGETPVTYLQRFQIEKAKNLLEKTSQTFEEITYRFGYDDINTFRNIFKKYTGKTPSAYRKKFGYNL